MQSVFGLDVLPEHSAKGMPGSSCGRSSNIPAKTALRLHPDVQGASPAVLYPIRFQESGRFPVATWRGRLV